jgi:hypothetical protein
MSQKSPDDQHKSSSAESAQAVDYSALSSPIVMITSQSGSVFVSDLNLTQWEEHPQQVER